MKDISEELFLNPMTFIGNRALKVLMGTMLALGTMCAMWVTNTQAALISQDFVSSGDGLITLDTSTNLQWLDMTQTLNMSYNNVVAGAGNFTTTYGFRYATIAEVGQFYTDAGIPDVTSTSNILNYTAANARPAQSLVALIGTGNVQFMYATTGSPSSIGLPDGRAMSTIQANGSEPIAAAPKIGVCTSCLDTQGSDNFANPFVGSFLVRLNNSPPPPPAPIQPFPNVITFANGPAYTESGLAPSQRRISFDGTAFVIDIDLGLTGFNPTQSLIDIFVSGIKNVWNDKYFIKDPVTAQPIPVQFNVDMAFNNPNADFQIQLNNTVGDTSRRYKGLTPDMNTWYTEIGDVKIPGLPIPGFPLGEKYTPATVSRDLNYALGDFAAHEFGHILGIPDEIDKNNPIPCTNLFSGEDLGLMGCWMELNNGLLGFGPVQTRYFEDILADIQNITRRFVEGSAPVTPFTHTGVSYGIGESHVTPRAVPEPSSIALFLLAICGLCVTRQRRVHFTKRLPA